MSPDTIEQEFKLRVGEAVRLAADGPNRYRVFTPFTLDDGDHLAIVLEHEHDQWALSDEGHTFMHLTYEPDETDLARVTRGTIINNTLAPFSVANHEGELRLSIRDGRFGDGLNNFIQTLLELNATLRGNGGNAA